MQICARIREAKAVLRACIFAVCAAASGQEMNVWTNTTGGKWEEPNWSLGILPGASQIVQIAMPTPITVEIDARTVANYEASLSMGHLVVSNANTLLLNHAGTDRPLHLSPGTNIWNGLDISGESKLVNLDSAVVIDSLLRVGRKGQIFQSGGIIRAPNTTYIHGEGKYHLTNGVFEAGWLELPSSGEFNQYGGAVNSGNLRLLYSTYNLEGGELNATNGESVSESAGFVQNGGTNRTPSLGINFYMGSGGTYILNGGLLCTSNLTVTSFMSESKFVQNGGVHIVTNAIELEGSARYYPPVITPGRYILGSNGVLIAGGLLLKSRFGAASFESEGTANISGTIEFNGQPNYIGQVKIAGGIVACSNTSNSNAVVDIEQTGGAFIVTNLFSFGGFYPGVFNGQGARPARYDFAGGTLEAENIELAAEWVIGSSQQSGRITNPGYFKIAGIMRIEDGEEELGGFVLAGDSTIDFSGRNAKLRFANSSGATWSGKLTVIDWNGTPGGGGAEQLKFGSDETGLTSTQLNQIRFVNPEGFPDGEYKAEILGTGEIIPSESGMIIGRQEAGKLVLNWSGTVSLQMSTNVAGPYADVVGAKAPYTCDMGTAAQAFFRLRR